MKTRTFLLASAAAVAATAAGYGLYSLGLQRGASTNAPVHAAAPSSPERKVLYWHDPMVPGARFDKAGKSPFMDMELVPVYADAAAPDSGVSISPRTQQNLGVRTAAVLRGSLAPRIEASGSVGWNERDTVMVSARANGFVERLSARAQFDRVARGQVLAELYVPEWVAAQEEFLALRKMAGTDMTSLVAAARQRMRQSGMTDEQIAGVEASGTVQPRVAVIAPIGGVLAEVGVREGASVMAGAPLFRINGTTTLWVHAELPESQAAQLRPGVEADTLTPSGTSIKGRVAALLPEVNAATRTLKVRVELPNAGGALVPGMFVTLRFKPEMKRDMLLIPSEAVIATGERNLVMVAQDNGGFMPVEVEPGLEANGQTEIRKGLQAGQRVVLSGQFLLDSEASLKGILNRGAAAASGARP